MTDGQEEIENAEERCVCLNTSFNVAEIAGLCASCIGMVADTQNSKYKTKFTVVMPGRS
jgi:hypothetical protein